MYPILRSAAAAAFLTSCAVGSWAAPVVLAGVTYPDTETVQGAKLQRNGAGIRYKAVFKVYTAALYLGRKDTTAEAIYAQPGSKRITITMLREIDSAELGRLFSRGMEDNMDRAAFSKVLLALPRMSQIFSDNKTLKPGETFTIDWIPDTGTVVTVKGVVQGKPFKEREFFNALLAIWLGGKPADWQLKDALLGKS